MWSLPVGEIWPSERATCHNFSFKLYKWSKTSISFTSQSFEFRIKPPIKKEKHTTILEYSRTMYTLILTITSSSAPITALYGSPNSPTVALWEQKKTQTLHTTDTSPYPTHRTKQRQKKYLSFKVLKPESMTKKSSFHTKKPFLQLIPKPNNPTRIKLNRK